MVRIGLAKDSYTFTPTATYSAGNGYDYTFPNGSAFRIEETGNPALSIGYTFGQTHKTNTFKATMSGSMAEAKAVEQYTHIAVYKDDSLVFCGTSPTFTKKIIKGVGADGNGESFVELSMSFNDYSTSLSEVQFNDSESWDLYYKTSDDVRIFNSNNTAKSLIHILFGYLNSSSRYTVHYCTMPSILTTTVVSCFVVSHDDKVLSVLSDVLKQAGLSYYVDKLDIYVVDCLATYSGTATNIANSSDPIVKEQALAEIRIPKIKRIDARTVSNVCVYDSGEQKIDNRTWFSEIPTYKPPLDEAICQGTFSYSDKKSGEVEKRFFNVRNRSFYGQDYYSIIGGRQRGASLYQFSSDNRTYVKYRIKNDAGLDCKYQLKVNSDVLLANYDKGYTPVDSEGNNICNGEEQNCSYVFSDAQAERYAEALRSAKLCEAKYIEFYADNDIAINTIITLQGTDEAQPLFVVINKTDRFDVFGGYTYKAVPYTRGGVSLSSDYVPSSEAVIDGSAFTSSVSRTQVRCLANETPKDTTPVKVTVNCLTPDAVPTVTAGSRSITPVRKTEEVVDDTGTLIAETNSWEADIDANLYGAKGLTVSVTLGDNEEHYEISKDIENITADVIKPAGYLLKTQYCYGTDTAPLERQVEDASNYLSDSSFIVSDLHWVDAESDGSSPLRPRVGYYIWKRQGTYQAPATAPTVWSVTRYSNPYSRFNFTASAETYIKDDRASGNNTIYIIPDTVGYDCTSLVVTAGVSALPFDAVNQRFTLTIAKKNAPTSMTVTAVLGALSWSKTLTAVDETELYSYGGILTTPPTEPLEGDSYVDGSGATPTYAIKVYEAGSWKTLSQASLSDAQKSVICGKAQKDVLSTISAGSVSASDYGYFNTLIAGTVTADYIKSQEGVFNSIIVNGESFFYGKFNCPTIESLPSTGGATSSVSIPAYVDRRTSTQFDAVYNFLNNLSIPIGGVIRCTSNTVSSMAYISVTRDTYGTISCNWHDNSLNRLGYTRRGINSSGYYYESNVGLQTITATIGGDDILKFKNVSATSVGLESGQIYYTVIDGNKVLCLK